MITATDYLNLYDIFFNEIVGDILLGVIAGLIILWIASIKRNMSLQLTLFFGILWLCVVFIGNTGLIIVWVLAVMAVGYTFYYNLAKALVDGNRGAVEAIIRRMMAGVRNETKE